jgi:hypothetical protein
MGLKLIVFAKAPVPGMAKTRLIPALGAQGAARVAAWLLDQTLEAARCAVNKIGQGASLQLCGEPAPEHNAWTGVSITTACELTQQVEGDLGRRMAHACTQALAAGDDVLLFGTDGIGLDTSRILLAARMLAQHDAVLQPVLDGGYVLLGLRANTLGRHMSLFEDMPWSTDQVSALTLARLQDLRCSVHVLPTLRDLDEPADLAHMWEAAFPSISNYP